MTRWVHLVGAAASIWLAWHLATRAPPPAARDPKELLTAFMSRAGFAHEQTRSLPTGEAVVVFTHRRCERPVDILYLPTVAHVSAMARDWLHKADGPISYVHNGARVAGLDLRSVVLRWTWRKFAVAVGAMDWNVWQTSALAVVDQGGCLGPDFDWSGLPAPANL